LIGVEDNAPLPGRDKGFKPKPGAGAYLYDDNGNMTFDPHKDITITYNFLNLPSQIVKTGAGGGTMSLTYDAAGRKWRKQVSGVTKDYCKGIEYKDGKVEAVYGQEGRLTAVYDQYGVTLTRFRAEYWLKDHLGNTRLAFADDNHNGTIEVWDDPSTPENEAEITQENHYYPFGMNHEGPWYATIGSRNGYQYNGKELNEELDLDWNDYGARWQDPATGRWWQVDPLAEKYFSISPFAYVANNPLIFVDPDGMRIIFLSHDEAGNEIDWSNIINELQKLTGLNLSIGEGGILEYDRPKGKLGGSKTARNMLLRAIQHDDDITVMNDPYDESRTFMNGDTKSERNKFNINFTQIQSFIDGTSNDLNPLTYGFGMNFLHELGHTEAMGAMLDFSGSDNAAANVDNMNKIRRQMSKATGTNFGQRVSYLSGGLASDPGWQYQRFSRHADQRLNNKQRPERGYIRHIPWNVLLQQLLNNKKKN
jgi:RHS repeat-associated protein